MKTYLKTAFVTLLFLLATSLNYFGQTCSGFSNYNYFNPNTQVIGDGSNTVQFLISDPNICGAEWTFTGGGLNAAVSFSGLNTSYTFPAAGTYSLDLVLTECTTGCSDTTSYLVYAGSCNGFSVDFTSTITGDSVFCDATVVGTTNAMLYGGSMFSVDNTNSGIGVPVSILPTGGWVIDGSFIGDYDSTYTACFITISAGYGNVCADTVCKDILMPPAPNCSGFSNYNYFNPETEVIGNGSNTLQFEVNNPNICGAEWTFTGGGLNAAVSFSGLNTSYTFPAAGTYSLDLVLTECTTGCSDTTSYLVYAGSCTGFSVDFTSTITGDSVFCDATVVGTTNAMLYGGSMFSVDNTNSGIGVPVSILPTGGWVIDGSFIGDYDSTYTACFTTISAGYGNVCADTVCKDILMPPAPTQQCINFVTSSDPEGVYLVIGDTSFLFDSTLNQQISMEVYGYFNNWDLSANHQADQTYFKVNGTDSVSLETIYNNQPYLLNGVTITVDTTNLNFPGFTSGTIIFTGNIDHITMVQFESGLIKICKQLNPDCGCEQGDCPCNIAAEFTYTGNNHNYNFLSAATGSEYEWTFGDGETSTITNPYHYYSTPGIYEVCLTNYNLTDTCSVTVCESITVECITPNANIITPNQDGIDDYVPLNCGSVNVYNRNGLLVVTLTNQTTWDGRDVNQNLVPMGEYILLCTDNQVAINVTVIR